MGHREQMLLFSDLFDALCSEVARKNGWNEDTDWGEYDFMGIAPIVYDGDRIDGLLFFADGTVEFHLEREQDALNWCEFPTKTIEDVLVKVRQKM